MADHVQIIKAEPDYYALDRVFRWDDPTKIDIVKVKVFAWSIRLFEDAKRDNAYYLEPICLEKLSDYYRNEVLHPDGRVHDFGFQVWDSLEEFEKEAKANHGCHLQARDRREKELANKQPGRPSYAAHA